MTASPRRAARRVYLDWNASAPLRPEARAAMAAAMDVVGNPSSQHGEGRRARAAIERAREQVAALVGAEPSEVVFTSGATEAANQALQGRPWGALRLSPGEHAAVREAALALGATPVDWAPPSASGALDPAAMAAPLAPEPGLLVAAAAQGETGAAEAPGALAAWGEASGARTFCDATQLAGKAMVETASGAVAGYRFDADYAAISAHKFGGPRGVGALLIREGAAAPEPLLRGGGQELRRRSGTENLIGVVGMGAAAAAAAAEFEAGGWEAARERRDRLAARMRDAAPDLAIIAEAAPWRLAATLCVAKPGARAETLLMRLDLAGFAVSAGSACSSGKMSPSPVLGAMGVSAELAAAALRISFGPSTTKEELDAFYSVWKSL